MKFRSLRRAAALLLALALTCSLLILPAAAASIAPDDLTLEVGQTHLLTVSDMTGALTWATSSRGHATVDESGLVTAVSPGKETIIVMDENGNSARCEVTVIEVPIPAESIRLNETYLSKTAGDPSFRLVATVTPSNTTDAVTFTSSNPDAVSVDSQGNLNFLNAGQAVRITASAGSQSAFCIVDVEARPLVSRVTVSPQEISIPRGTSKTITATVEGAATDKTVLWSSSAAVVSYPPSSQSGAPITINAPADAPLGQITLTARAGVDPTKSDFCVISIIDAPTPQVTSVSIISPFTDAFRYVDPGESMTLEATAYPLTASEEARKIIWDSDNTDIAKVNRDTGVVTGVAPGQATITARVGGGNAQPDTRVVETSGILLSYIERTPSGGAGEAKELTEDTVVPIYQYRDITAKWELFGSAKSKTITWTSSNNSVAQVLAGRVTANYPGEATITASVDGTGFTASFKVRVSEDIADAIEVDMGSSPTYSFSDLLSTLNDRSVKKAGAPLDNLYNLKVSTKNGVLYYRYTSSNAPGHGVGGTERYYYQAAAAGQMAIRDVSFVPLPGFNGTAVVDYNAAATNGSTFTGTIRIKAAASGDVNYSTGVDQPVSLVARHFSDVCQGRSGRALGYVTFTQPAASRGTLYENYNASGLFSPKADSSTRYYASSNPSIDSLTFVPAAGYQGEVAIPYRGVDSSGASYSGTVTITVAGSGGTAGSRDVEYSTGRNQRQDLNASDFNDACQRATGSSLDRIRFDSLPSSGAGTLYLNYTSTSSSQAAAGRNYYRSASPRISSLSFVPARNYSGTVTIPFTATSTDGDTFSGDLIIHVADGAGDVRYTTPRNQAVFFRASDFNDACRRINGTTLNYVRFTSLPSSSAGTLYSNYVSANSLGTRVTTGTDYRRSGSPSLSGIAFVPASGYSGTVSIPFTGYDDSGARFSGTVSVAVGGGGQVITYSVPANGSVRLNASDFNSACRSATGDTLNYVRFDAASTGYGALYYQYNAAGRTGTAVSTGTGYYYSGNSRLLGDVSFAANSSAGTAVIGYTGYSTRGGSFSGTVEITVSASGAAAVSAIRYTGSAAPIRFRSSDFQAACQAALGSTLSYVQFNSLPAAGHLYQNYSGPARTGTGVTGATRYTLQDLDQISYVPKAEYQGTLSIPYTAYSAQGTSHSGTVEIQLSTSYCATAFTDVAYGWDWAKPSIEYLRQSGITSGYRDGTFRPGQSISRGEFTLMVCRAFQFTTGGSSGFPDVPANSTYAGAVAAARNLGIVQGNNGRFQPDRPITRQSAMAMICRALEAAGQSVPAADSSLLSAYGDAAQVSAFARPSVASLVQMGAVRGNSSMRLNPTAPISRAEMAVILHRVLTR